MVRYRHIFKRIFNRSSVTRMSMIIAACIGLVHEVACFWFLIAKFDDFSPQTWVAKKTQVDDSLLDHYMYSTYWALQTLVTVGYGDYPARTIPELLLCVVWMVVGVFFYSFLVGAIQSQVQSELKNQDTLKYKLK